jgi:hypothetical protein
MLYEGVTVMFRFAAYILAALAIVSFFSVADTQAGNRHERRIHNHQKNFHYRMRHTVRMRSINADRRHYSDRRFTRGTLSFRVDRDRRNRYRHHYGHYRNHHYSDRYYARYPVNAGNVVIINVDGDRSYRLPVYQRRDVNTYSGDVDTYSVPGVGTYSYGEGSSDVIVTRSVPSATIIDVKNLKPNNGCQMQAGVCVIRP